MVALTVFVKTTKVAFSVHCVKHAYYPIRICYLISTGEGVPLISQQIKGCNPRDLDVWLQWPNKV